MSNKKILLVLCFVTIALVGVLVLKKSGPLPISPALQLASETPVPEQNSKPQSGEGARAQKSAPAVMSDLTEEDRQKLRVLSEILESKNDNDPRIDQDFNQLSPKLKAAMVSYYQQIPLEKRNERGTIVFLLSKNLSTPDDLAFMRSVLMEKPCLSLSNCNELAPSSPDGEGDLDGVNEVTESYPQLTAIQQMLEAYQLLKNNSGSNSSLENQILEVIREGVHSPNPKVSAAAQKAVEQINGN